MKCRSCNGINLKTMIDLKKSPPSNAYRKSGALNIAEEFIPLRVSVCNDCYFVQTEDYVAKEIMFDEEYAYTSSTSSSWLQHCGEFVSKAIKMFNLTKSDQVIEIAANDGYLLQFFVNEGIPCLGVEPTESTAEFARKKGIDIEQCFLTKDTSMDLFQKYGTFKLLIGNNVLAHVPDINDFVSSCKRLLAEDGCMVFEFPHLLQLLLNNQFDTIYHEHFSYLSLYSLNVLFEKHELKIIDAEELDTHGGSLRIYVKNFSNSIKRSGRCEEILQKEKQNGVNNQETYVKFSKKIKLYRLTLREFVNRLALEEKNICGYGAAAKGNTLINFCGLNNDDILAIFDKSVLKQGKYTPGSEIPIVSPEKINEFSPDVIIIFPWNIASEAVSNLRDELNFMGDIYTLIPTISKLN